MKRLLLKIFKTEELIKEIQRREWRFPPEENKKNWDVLLKKIKEQFPEFIELLKIREYNLAQNLVIADEEERSKLAARMAEVKYWQFKLTHPFTTSFSEEVKKEMEKDIREVKEREEGLKRFIKKFLSK